MAATSIKLALTKSEFLDDWYLIERAEHDGREWIERVVDGDGSHLAVRVSSRFSDADVEGTAEEMRDIAKAIRAGEGLSFRRCAVIVDGDTFWFQSPRNSTRPGGPISQADAQALADEIFAKLGSGEA